MDSRMNLLFEHELMYMKEDTSKVKILYRKNVDSDLLVEGHDIIQRTSQYVKVIWTYEPSFGA